VPEYNEFDTDLHRRVAGNLQIPRSPEALVLTFERHDPDAIGSTTMDYDRGAAVGEVSEVLADLEADGVVAKVGAVADVEEAVDVVNTDNNVVDIDAEQAELFAEVVASQRPNKRHLNVDGELWILTNKGLEKLTGTIPNPPPPVAAEEQGA
jgi:hypothetical protein